MENSSRPKLGKEIVNEIIGKYENHPSFSKIEDIQKSTFIFNFPKERTVEINRLIKSLKSNKATGLDGIPLKGIETAANIIDSNLANIINNDLAKNKFSEDPRNVLVRIICKN